MKAARRPYAIALAAILLLGVLLRLTEYLGGRQLWVDELMLALSVGRRSFGGLLTSLGYDQHAPVLFLWSVKATTLLAGMGAYALRFVPLLGGALLPYFVFRMTTGLAGRTVALIAAVLAAVSVPLIYYSAELKPYELDALTCAVLILLTLRARAAPDRLSRWTQLGIGGALALLCSLPAPFVLVGAAVALVADPGVRHAPRAPARLVLVFAAWAACLVVLYATVYKSGAADRYLRLYWEGTFLDPRAPDFVQRLVAMGTAVTAPLTALPDGFAMRWRVLVLAAGVALLFRRAGAPAALQIGVPFFALAVASALGQYPISTRLLLALSPALFVLAAVPLAELLRLARVPESVAGPAGVLLVVAAAAPQLIANGRLPIAREEGRESARWVERESAGDPVYVLASGLPAWAYYTTDWKRPDTARLDRYASLAAGPSAPNGLVSPDAWEELPAAIRRKNGTLELIGVRSGIAYREPGGFLRDRPDSAWAGLEVERMLALECPYLWVYGSHWSARELPALRAEFARRGIVVVGLQEERSAFALRIRLPVRRH